MVGPKIQSPIYVLTIWLSRHDLSKKFYHSWDWILLALPELSEITPGDHWPSSGVVMGRATISSRGYGKISCYLTWPLMTDTKNNIYACIIWAISHVYIAALLFVSPSKLKLNPCVPIVLGECSGELWASGPTDQGHLLYLHSYQGGLTVDSVRSATQAQEEVPAEDICHRGRDGVGVGVGGSGWKSLM